MVYYCVQDIWTDYNPQESVVRTFFLLFRSDGSKPSFSTAEGGDLLDALTRLKKEARWAGTQMPDLVLAFDMKPESASVDALEVAVREAVAKHLGIAGIAD